MRFSWMYDEIVKSKAKVLMEVGVYRCERSLEMIKLAQAQDKPNKTIFYGFDLFENLTPEIKKKEVSRPFEPLTKIDAYKVLTKTGAKIVLIGGDTKTTLPQFVQLGMTKPDIIFIDGGHSLETASSDLKNCLQLMHNDTVIFVDDYSKESKEIFTKVSVDAVNKEVYDVSISPQMDKASTTYGNVDLRLARIKKK